MRKKREMDELTLRRSISPPEAKELADSVYKSASGIIAVQLAVLAPISVATCAGAGALVGVLFGSAGIGALVGAVIGLVLWVASAALGLAIGIPLGLLLARNRLESKLGPHRELAVTWYPNGFSIADRKGSRLIPFADVRRARWVGRRREFIVMRTAFTFNFAPDRHGIPSDLVPREVLQRWTDEGLLR